MKRSLRILAVAAFGFVAVSSAWAQKNARLETILVSPFERRVITVPMASAGPKGLDGILLLPKTPGRHPLVLMIHTHSDFRIWASEATPKEMLPGAEWFASRGWAVAIADPRGIGRSGGKWLRVSNCTQQSVDALGKHSAEDLEALYDAVRHDPAVDDSTVVVAGDHMSAVGGLWLAANGPKGLKAVVAFDLGPWMAGMRQCTEKGIVPAYAALGGKVKLPSLWVASEKGGILKGSEVRQIHAAYTAAGATAQLEFVPSPKDSEVETFGTKKENWSPVVEAFLEQQHLPSVVVVPVPVLPKAELLGVTSLQAQDAFQQYLAAPPSKAFAVGEGGRYGWAIGRHDLKTAKEMALDYCRHMSCHVVAVEE